MIEQIDTRFKEIEQAICCLHEGDVLIDPGPAASIDNVIEALGDIVPRVILLTHIHLDHAGGTGKLVEHYPDAQVFIHGDAAQHLADPSRLLASAGRTFGDRLVEFGETIPVPASNINSLADGDIVEGFQAVHTPGHSAHHLVFWHDESQTALVGDLVGQVLAPHELTLISSTPPENDVELWLQSIDRVAELYPSTLEATHYGRITDVADQFARAKRELRRGSEFAQEHDQDEFIAELERMLQGVSPEVAESLVTALPPFEQLYLGYDRYWSKREPAHADGSAAEQ